MSNKDDEKRSLLGILIIFIATILFVGLCFVFSSMVENESNSCKQIGGKRQVVDREYSIVTKTYVSVYGCVK